MIEESGKECVCRVGMALVFLCNQGGWLGDTGLPLFGLLVMLLPRFFPSSWLVVLFSPFSRPYVLPAHIYMYPNVY